jgi:hypothetical protein
MDRRTVGAAQDVTVDFAAASEENELRVRVLTPNRVGNGQGRIQVSPCAAAREADRRGLNPPVFGAHASTAAVL